MEHRLDKRAPHQRELVFPGAAFPGASEVIRDAYEQLWDATNLTDTEIEAHEQELALTAALLADFCDEYVSPSVYTAAMLCPIIEASENLDTHAGALDALRRYANNTTEPEENKRYALGLAADRPVIASFWRDNVQERYSGSPELQHLLQREGFMAASIDQWQSHAQPIEPKHINRLVSSVNLESLLIKAAELLAQLDPKTAINDGKTLNRAHQAEALLAPLCEIIGFDALAMALYSHVHVLRAMFTGNLGPLQLAQDIITERGNKEQVNRDVEELFGVIFGDNIHKQIINHGADHDTMMGEGYCTSECLRVNWRLKSVGSLTKKLSTRSPENIPLDIIGATITTQDVSRIASRLLQILERADLDERVTLTPTSERRTAIHVKGTSDYIETIREGLGFESLEAMQEVIDVVETNTGAYRVCKVTLVFAQSDRPDLRAEIQIATQADRIENRIGQAAHILYKLLKRIGQTDETFDRQVHTQDLAMIHERKVHLTADRSHLLTGISLHRANSLYAQLTNPAPTPFLQRSFA